VLITGASGFSARHLARRLRGKGPVRILGVSRRTPSEADAGLWDIFTRLEALTAPALSRFMQLHRPDSIFHLAGTFTGSEAEMHQANVVTTEALLAAVRSHAPQACVLLVGSAAEYGTVPLAEMPVRESREATPESPYGRSKLAATRLGLAHAQDWGCNVRIARPFNIVGAGVPSTLVTGALIERTRRVVNGEQPVVRVGNIETKRDFIAVDDVADAYVEMIRPDCAGQIFNVCSGRACSIRSLIDLLRTITGHPIPIEVDPALVRPADVLMSYGSCEKANRAWGFMPKFSLEQALAAAWRSANEKHLQPK
jgi:GDP-4-dehydro-6-deoxy-D-mannose reductase